LDGLFSPLFEAAGKEGKAAEVVRVKADESRPGLVHVDDVARGLFVRLRS